MIQRIPVAEALAQLLVAHQVPAIYGIVGGKMTPFLKALAGAGAPRFIGVRHEAAAALMATAEGMASRVPAVAMAEQAPGMVNLASGLGTARANNLAVVAITISTPRALIGRGAMMEIDAAGLFGPVTKASLGLTEARRLPDQVRRAFREAVSGRPGPVHLDIPADLLTEVAMFDAAGLTAPLALPVAPAPDPAAIAVAAGMLAGARRPLLIFGGGVVRAGAWGPAQALAEKLGAAVLVSQMGLGVLPSGHGLLAGQGGVIGGPQVRRALAEADVVLAVGCRLSSWFWGENGLGLAAKARLVQVDIDAGMLGKAATVALAIQADAGLALRALIAAVPGRQTADWGQALVAERRAHLAGLAAGEAGTRMHPGQLAAALGEMLPPEALVTLDGGHTSFWHNDLLPARATLRLFHDPGQAQLGFGLPFALALKRARPGVPVICTTGDGSFGFTLAELDTARRQGLAVIVVIHNNASWGVIAANQARAGFALETDLSGTDYAAIARGFGCRGVRIETLVQFRAAFAKALGAKVTTVLDCRTAFVPHPMLPAFGRSTQALAVDIPLPG